MTKDLDMEFLLEFPKPGLDSPTAASPGVVVEGLAMLG